MRNSLLALACCSYFCSSVAIADPYADTESSLVRIQCPEGSTKKECQNTWLTNVLDVFIQPFQTESTMISDKEKFKNSAVKTRKKHKSKKKKKQLAIGTGQFCPIDSTRADCQGTHLWYSLE